MAAAIPTTNDLLAWALYYYGLGWSIVPVDPGTKKPRLPAWKRYQTMRATEQQIREWFGTGKHTALAIVLGAVSGGLGALDFDCPETFGWFKATQPDLARILPTEETARGHHVFFRCKPTGTQTPKDQNIELRCEGAYIIVAPSPGKRWLRVPNGEITVIEPFRIGLEAFGITEPGSDLVLLTEETETNPPEMASVSCVSSVSSGSSVNWSFDAELRQKIGAAISQTLPTGTGQRNRCIFTLCRRLKAIPELRDRAAKDLRPIIQDWHAQAYPIIRTKPFEDTWADFVHGWKRVKHPLLFDMAVQGAHQDPLNPPEAEDYKDPRTQLLVRICWQLQQVHGDEPFYLSIRKAGKLVDLSHTEAGKRLEMLMEDGVLAIATVHTNVLATRYKYIGRGYLPADGPGAG